MYSNNKKVRELSNNIEVLAPQNIFFKGDLAKYADSFEVIDNIFENVNICELSIVHLIDKEANKYNKEEVSLPAKDLPLAKAIKKYNETHKRTWEKLTGWNRYDPKKKMSEAAKNSFKGVVSDNICEEAWKQGRLFQSTTCTPSNGVHQDENTWDYKCYYDNLYPFGMGARPKTGPYSRCFCF